MGAPLPHSARSSLLLTALSFICASVSSSDSTSDLSLHSPEWWWTWTGPRGLYFHVPSGTNQYQWGLDLWHFPCNRLFWATAWKLHHEGGWMWDLGVPWVRKAAQSNSCHCKKGAQQLWFHLGKWRDSQGCWEDGLGGNILAYRAPSGKQRKSRC